MRLPRDPALREHAHVDADHRLAVFVGDDTADDRGAPQDDAGVGEPLAVGEGEKTRRGVRGCVAAVLPVEVAEPARGQPVVVTGRQIDERESSLDVGQLAALLTGRLSGSV